MQTTVLAVTMATLPFNDMLGFGTCRVLRQGYQIRCGRLGRGHHSLRIRFVPRQ